MTDASSHEHDAEPLREWLRYVFQVNLLAAMTPTRRAAIADVTLEIPTNFPAEYAADPGFPLHICADPNRRAIICPVRTIRWLDEYAGTWAWLHKTRGDEAVTLLMLFAAMTVASPRAGVYAPGPFQSFRLDAAIYDDDFVKDVSNKCLNGSICFLLLHELGHLALRHSAPATPDASQHQERAADAYALDAMAELHILSLGVPTLFFATAAMELGQTSHPLSGNRIGAIAERLETDAFKFVDRNDPHPARTAQKLREHGAALRAIAVPKLIDEAERSQFVALARRYRLEDLRGMT
jgi:hypothetical protein